jgi:hypothetical protein
MAIVIEPSLGRGPAPESSERSFGIVFTVVFAVVALWPLLYGGPPRLWAVGTAAGIVLIALLRPRLLRPLNRLWLAFGRLLHRVMSPIVMGAIFFLCVTPIALIMRWLGKDVLSTTRRPDLASYWVAHEGGSDPDAMKRQF